MKQSVKVLYHANCDDGFGAAYAAWCFFKEREEKFEVEYHAVSYGNESKIPRYDHNDLVYIVDFSYKRETIEMIKSTCKQLVILDHHKTAEKELTGLDYAIFDMSRSGAMITWEYFHKQAAPVLIRYIQDNDLWQHKLEYSKEITRLIRSYQMTFQQWDFLHTQLSSNIHGMFAQANGIERYYQQQMKNVAKQAKFFTDNQGRKTCILNCNATFTSEVGHFLIKENQLNYSVSWFEDAQGKCVMSFRGDGTTDVSEIAKQLGGGGHKSAAGVIGDIVKSQFFKQFVF